MNTLTIGRTVYGYTVVDATDPLRALVAYTLDGHPCGYGFGALDSTGFTPWCHCDHEQPHAARACHRAREARESYDAEQARLRTAAIPAPAGARFLAHCGGFWRAALGGACSVCGAAGDVLAPTALVYNDRSQGWTTITTDGIAATAALTDAGVKPGEVRLAHGTIAYVTGLRAAELGAALSALGWTCTVRASKPRARGVA